MKIVQETERLYRLTRYGTVNCFFLKDDDGCTLIDTNLGGSAKAILEFSRSLASPIRRILLTHGHFDHVASLDDLVSALPQVEVLVGARESRLLEGDFSLDAREHGKRLAAFGESKK